MSGLIAEHTTGAGVVGIVVGGLGVISLPATNTF